MENWFTVATFTSAHKTFPWLVSGWACVHVGILVLIQFLIARIRLTIDRLDSRPQEGCLLQPDNTTYCVAGPHILHFFGDSRNFLLQMSSPKHWHIAPTISSALVITMLSPVFEVCKNGEERPGPFYHVNEVSVYLGRQRGEAFT